MSYGSIFPGFSTLSTNNQRNNARGIRVLGSSSYVTIRMGGIIDAFSHNGMPVFIHAVGGAASSSLAGQYTGAGLDTIGIPQIVCIGVSVWNDTNMSPYTGSGASLTAWNSWKTNVQQIIDWCRRDGHIPVVFKPSPSDGSSGQSTLIPLWNAWANGLDCYVVNASSTIQDPATYLYLTGTTNENTHPNDTGCGYMAQSIPGEFFKSITSYRPTITPKTGYARRPADANATIAPFRLDHPPTQRGAQYWVDGATLDLTSNLGNPHTLVIDYRQSNVIFRIWGYYLSEASQTQIQNVGPGNLNLIAGGITGGTAGTMFTSPAADTWYKLVIRFSPADNKLRFSLINVVTGTVTAGASVITMTTTKYHYLTHAIARSSGGTGGNFDLRSVAYYMTHLDDSEVALIASAGTYYPGMVGYWQFGDAQQLDAPINQLPFNVGLTNILASAWSNVASS